VSTRIGRSGVICVLLILLSIPSPAQAQAKWKGSVVKDGDVIIVKNPEKPLYKTPILELREDLSIGGPDAQGDEAFDRVQGVVVDDAGAVYVLDYRASNIKAYDATGKYVRTIGRNGQGPGELESPTTLSLNRPRAELAVHVPPRGIVFFNTDGTFLRQLSFKGLIANRGLVDSRGQIYVVETIMDEKEPRYATRKLGPDASAVATISETPAQVKGGNKVRAFPPTGYFMIDRDDRLIYGYPETYEIQFYDPAETKVHKKILRDYDPPAVTAKEKTDLEMTVPPGMKVEIEFPEDHPAYSRFFASDLGHLFVQTSERADGGKLIHDIFDAEGRFIGRVALKPFGLEILKGKYYALEEDEEGYQYVKRYAVTWKVR